MPDSKTGSASLTITNLSICNTNVLLAPDCCKSGQAYCLIQNTSREAILKVVLANVTKCFGSKVNMRKAIHSIPIVENQDEQKHIQGSQKSYSKKYYLIMPNLGCFKCTQIDNAFL
jgi:hypothetical protein